MTLSENENWEIFKAGCVEADERDIPAREAFQAGYRMAPQPKPSKPWHESAASVLTAALLLAAICYFIAGAPH